MAQDWHLTCCQQQNTTVKYVPTKPAPILTDVYCTLQWEDHFQSRQRFTTVAWNRGVKNRKINLSVVCLSGRTFRFCHKVYFCWFSTPGCLCITNDLLCTHNSVPYSQNKGQSHTQVIKDFTQETPKEKNWPLTSFFSKDKFLAQVLKDNLHWNGLWTVLIWWNCAMGEPM